MKKSYLLSILLLLTGSCISQAITLTGHLIYSAGCDSQLFRVTASAYNPTMSLVTYFGDGSSRSDTFFSNTPYRAYTTHHYTTSGNYTVKHVLTVGGVPVDSLSYPDTITLCHNMHIMSFVDNNSNCIYDAGDNYLVTAYTLEVDSASVPIDTLSGISFNYAASIAAPPGTIYTFKVLTNPINHHVTCPANGIVKDTIGTGNGWHRIGFACDSAGFDLAVYGWFRGGVTGSCAHVYAYNYRCGSQAATVTLNYSPKYTYSGVYPSGVGVTTGSGYVTVNLGNVNPIAGCVVYFTPVGMPTLGDTTHTTWTVNPIAGDANPANNVLFRIDTVHTSFDPNDKAVTPQGNILAGTALQYKIGFENLGSDTAFNIHIMDTLSDNLDANTLQVVSASGQVFSQVFRWNGHYVVKFDLPNIRLLDTTHAGKNTGLVAFSINTKGGLPDGTVISNKAGIYFDANPVVITNTTYNTIGDPLSVSVLTNAANVLLYPNPAGNELTIMDPNRAYSAWQLSDLTGRIIKEGAMQGRETHINTGEIVPGLYEVHLSGVSGSKTLKLQKM